MRYRRIFLRDRGYYDYLFQMEDCEYEDLVATLEQLSELDATVEQCIATIKQTTTKPTHNETQFFIPGDKSELTRIVAFAPTRLAKAVLNKINNLCGMNVH